MRTIKIGRSSECDIVLNYNKISRVHAVITQNNGQYIYQDVSKNGSNIGGRIVIQEKIVLAPGTTVLLANKVPLPWEQVYAMLPARGHRVDSLKTVAGENHPHTPYSVYPNAVSANTPSQYYHSQAYKKDELGVGWGILAFLIPLAGWIMYFAWKENTPNRAKWAGIIAFVSFGIGLLSLL